MKDELKNDGYIAQNGEFVFNENIGENDAWLDSISWNTIKPNIGQKAQTEQSDKNSEPDGNEKSEQDLFRELLSYMNDSSNVSSLIKTFGSKSSSCRDIPKMMKITDIADKLLGMGHFSIYDYNKNKVESLVKSLDAKKVVENSTAENKKNESVLWYFKWKNDSKEELHGPYDSETMDKWVETGYFSNGAFVTKSKKNDSVFYDYKRIDFSLYF
ncbi:MAG: CD2 antigen cytoplasmic tail-binding protein 2 [Paramarteilia canceri]